MKRNRNIYQYARERTGFTQEAVAEQLCISIESLRMYETGRRRPSDEMVMLMADIYHDEALIYRHIKTSPAGCVLPELTDRSLQECSMRLFRLMRSSTRGQYAEMLLEIAEDGVVDAREEPIYNEIMKEFREISEAIFSVSFASQGQEKTPYQSGNR